MSSLFDLSADYQQVYNLIAEQEDDANSSNQLKDILRDEANKFIQITENSGLSEKYKDEISKLKMMDVNTLDKQQIIKTRNLIRRRLGEIES